MDNQTFLLIAFLVVLGSLIWGGVGYMIGYKKGHRAGWEAFRKALKIPPGAVIDAIHFRRKHA